MKHKLSITLFATGIATMLAFTNCQKDVSNAGNASANEESGFNSDESGSSALSARTTEDDRLTAIVTDLAKSRYSFKFSAPNYEAGITRTAYGADNYLLFADPQDLICPDPIRRIYRKIPIWRRPNFIIPTCPDMIIDITRIKEIQELLIKAYPNELGGLKTIRRLGGGGVFTTERMMKQYASLTTDRVDGLTKDLNPERFLLLGAPDTQLDGVFRRDFYGFADLNSIVFKPYRTNLKNLLKPTLKGCFDPQILKVIRERLANVNPALYKGLVVSPLEMDKSIAVMY